MNTANHSGVCMFRDHLLDSLRHTGNDPDVRPPTLTHAMQWTPMNTIAIQGSLCTALAESGLIDDLHFR